MVLVSNSDGVRFNRVADAFGVSTETLRLARRKYEQGGIEGLVERGRRGRPRVQTAELEEELFAIFDDGVSIPKAHKLLGERVSRSVVSRVHVKWVEQRERTSSATTSPSREVPNGQLSFADVADTSTTGEQVASVAVLPTCVGEHEAGAGADIELQQPVEANDDERPRCAADELELEEVVQGATRRVQHLGCWIMLAMLHALGLYQLAEGLRAKTERERRRQGKKYLGAVMLRAALDAVAVALSLGKRCVEGVCDFYVHDDEGRPLVRIADPANGPLTDWLLPAGRLLRTALGGETKVLLVFDRGGAYPGCLAELRDEGLEALRPEVPTHAPVEDTELAGKLVRHPGDYKLVIDTLRVALANVESDLAAWLAPELHRPKEAKKHLAKLFDAPGTIRPNGKCITVALEPPSTIAELAAFEALISRLKALRLTLPGDPSQRRLRFKLQRN